MAGLYDRRFSYLLRVELERQESSLWDALGQIDIRRRGGIRDISRTVFGGTVLRTLMNIETQEKVFNETVEQMRNIMFKKGNDYANEDRLSNFKLAGTIAGLNAELNCLSLIATKVARLGVLLNTKGEPNNESVEDSLIDLANYAVLLRMILKDKPAWIVINDITLQGERTPISQTVTD